MTTKTESILNLESFFVDQVKANFSGEVEGWFDLYDGRGVFGGALTIWLMLLQAMNDGSEARAIQLLQEGCADLVLKENAGSKKARQKAVNAHSGGYNKAKNRLPVVTVEDVFEVINCAIMGGKKKPRTAILDGSGLILSCGLGIEAEFPRRGNGRVEKLYYPEMRIVFATDLETGIAVCPEYGPMGGEHATSEVRLSKQVIDRLDEGTTVIADRAFGIFSVVSHCVSTGKNCVVRLPSSRAGKIYPEKEKEKEVDAAIVWEKSPHDRLLDSTDVVQVPGRFIQTTLIRNGYRPIPLMLFTTDMEASKEDLVTLYGQRLNIETDIRYLKNQFGISRIISKSTSMIRKELLVRIMGYNLLKKVTAAAATQVGLQPRRVSFQFISASAVSFGIQIARASSEQQRQDLLARFLIIVRQARIPTRKPRQEPRCLTHKKDNFPSLKIPRATFKANLRDS